MKKIQDYIKIENNSYSIDPLFYNLNIPENTKSLIKKGFNNDYYFNFEKTDAGMKESARLNSTLKLLHGSSIPDIEIQSIVFLFMKRILNYSINQNNEPLNEKDFSTYFNLVYLKSREETAIMFNEKIFDFNSKLFIDSYLKIKQKFYFTDKISYWKYDISYRNSNGININFSFFYRYTPIFQKEIYFLNIQKIKISNDLKNKTEVKSIYSEIYQTKDEFIEKMFKKIDEILLSKLSQKINRHLNQENNITNENLEEFKKIVNMTIY